MLLSLILSIFLQSPSYNYGGLSVKNSLKYVDTMSNDYDQTKVLNSFCVVLRDLKKHYNITEKLIGYHVKKNRPLGFFVYDLSDTLNNSKKGSVNFKEGHIYHFAPVFLYYSYSNFCFLSKGKLVFFKAVNCKKPINNINEVISFLNNNLPDNVESKRIIKRVSNYKRYADYFYIDFPICKCEL